MSKPNSVQDKKKALLAYKEKILQDIQYYEKRLDDFRANQKYNCYYSDSSDSEDYFPNAIDIGPDEAQLKLQQSMLKTCLNATQELTNLTVLQSEVNVLVQDPQFNGEPPVTEAGTWKEVTAECRIDLVPFTITFYMHKPDRKFAPTSYRGLKVALIKSAHEAELDKSVLHTLKTPSDAIEIVRSYAVAHRSRRTTLARLANKYASSLFMEPHPEGGFILKCGNLLEILWRLENKWSQVAPFHHRMKFDLEYMDESYIKTITQAHKQLLDPSLQTDERTLLLSKIIATCLEARGPVDSESDLESRQTSIQPEIETAEAKDKDRDVMAPPKSLPKKTKKIAAKDKDINKDMTKDKFNKDMTKDKVNKELAIDKKLVKDKSSGQKRSIENENKNQNAKKLKMNEEVGAKEGSKAKENVKNDDNKKQNKNSNVNNDGIKKKPSEDQDIAKKTKNIDKSKKTDKNNKQNENTNVDENNKNATNTNAAKKRKNDDVLEDVPKTNNIKGPKKAKSNEEIKKKINEKSELIPKKVKSNKNDKQTKNTDVVSKNTDVVSKNNENVQNTNAGNKGKNGDQVEEPKPKNTNGKAQKGISNDGTKNNNNKNGATDGQTKNNEHVINDNKTEESSKIKGKTKEKNKNVKDNDNVKKIDRKTKMSIANDNKFDQITKKVTSLNKDAEKNQIKNVANAKNSIEYKNNDNVDNNKGGDNKKIKNIEKKNIANAKSAEMAKNKKTGNTIDKTVTEKNATNFKNKEKIANINKVPEKLIKDKPIAKNDKILEPKTITSNKKLTKIGSKSVRDIIHKSPKNKNALKPQNPLKTTNSISNGNTKIFFGSTEKENGAKISKIPQIRNSLNIRVSPRLLPSKFKSISKDTNIKNMTKSTNIPRLMKKPVPKTSR